MLIHITNIKNLSEIMQKINTSYGIYYNKQENRVGHVFRNRYNMKEIQTEGHLLRAIAYIHQNPLKAKIVEKIADYKFSSYNLYKKRTISEKTMKLTFNTINYMELFDFIHSTFEDSIMFENEDIENKKIDFNERKIKEDILKFCDDNNISLEILKKENYLIQKIVKNIKEKYIINEKDILKLIGIGKNRLTQIRKRQIYY